MNRKLSGRKALKILLWLLGVLVGLVVLVLLLLQTSFVQQFARKKIAQFLEKKIHTEVSIGRLDVDFPKRLVLQHVYFADQQGDTLFAGDTLKVDLNMWKLLRNEILIQELDLRGITAYTSRNLIDSSFNFDYIIKAFVKEKKTASADTSRAMLFSINTIKLDRIRVRHNDEVTGIVMKAFLRHFDTQITAFDLEQRKFTIPKIQMNGLNASLHQTKALSDETITTDTISLRPAFPDIQLGEIILEDINLDYGNTITAIDSKLALGKLKVEVNALDLPNKQIDVRLLRLENTSGEFALSQEAQKAVESTTTEVVNTMEKGWHVKLSDFELENIEYTFEDLTSVKVQNGIDYEHLHVSDLSVKASNLLYTPDSTIARFEHLALKEHSGIEIKNFKADLKYGKQMVSLKDFLLETPQTILKDEIVLTYPSLDSVAKDPGVLGIHAQFIDNEIAVKDILLFVPQLANRDPFKRNKNAIIKVNGLFDGHLNDFNIADLSVSGLGSLQFHGSGAMQGLPDMNRAFFNLQIDELSANAKDIIALLPAGSIPTNIRVPDQVRINGNFKGSMANFTTNMHVGSSFGAADIKATIKNSTSKNNLSYDANFITSQFNLGKLLRRDSVLGAVTMSASIKGHGTDLKTLVATYNGKISSAYYKGYTYHNLEASGSANHGELAVKANMHDPNLTFALDATGNLNGTYPRLNFTLLADSINLQPLHLLTNDLRFHGKVIADLQTADPDYLNGTIDLAEAVVVMDGQRYPLDTIHLTSVATAGEDSLLLQSEFLTLKLKGQYQLTKIVSELRSTIDHYFDTRLVEDVVTRNEPQQVTFEATIVRSPLLEEVLPDLKEMDDATLTGEFNSTTKAIKLQGGIPRLRYKDYTVDEFNLDVHTENNALNYNISLDQLSSQQLQLLNTSISGKAENNILSTKLQVDDEDEKEQYRIAGELKSTGRYFEFNMLSDGLLLNYTPWNVAPDNAIQYGKEGIMIRNFEISNAGQKLQLNSSPQQLNAPIEVDFTDFKIETATRLVSKDSLLAGGVINGKANVRNLNVNPVFTADLNVKDFSFHGDTVGDVALKVNNETANTYKADVAITGKGNDIKIIGSYQDVGDQSLYDLDVNLVRLNLKSIEGFTADEINNATGTLDGKLKVTGPLSAPNVRGNIHFNQTGFTITRLNSYYKASDEMLEFTSEGLRFNTFTLVDSAGNEAILDGMVFTKDYKDYRFGLDLQADDFQIMNSTRQQNELYFGQLYIDTHLRIKGGINNPVVDGNVRINEKTKLTVVIPQEDPGIVERKGIVEFVDMDTIELNRNLPLPDSLIKSEITGIDVAVSITVDKEAELNLIIDEANGDYLNVKGEANLTGGIDPSGKIALTGTYELEEGSYRFSFNQVKREFNIAKGSTITWTGDPLNADVNVTAVYKADIAPITLVQNQLAEAEQNVINTYKQKIPFEIQLNMDGELLKPDVTFNIALAEGNAGVSSEVINTVQTRLTQLRTEPSELNKQVFAVLLLNRFIAEDPFANEAREGRLTSLARQSASKLLTEQLNNLIGGNIAGFDVTFDINSIEDYTTGELKNRTDVTVGLSKQLLDDRLKISVGSNFELEGPQESDRKTTNIAGDVSAEYQISKDGRYRIRAYRKDEYIVVQGQVVETGVGFVFTTDYEKLKDIFAKKSEAVKMLKKAERLERKEERKSSHDE